MQGLDPSPPFQSEKIPPQYFSAQKKKLFVFRWKDLQISGDFGFKTFFTASLPKSWTSFEPHKGMAVPEEPSAITLSIQNVGQSSVQNHRFLRGFVGGFPWTLKVRLANISDLNTPETLFSWSSSFEASFREQVPWFQGSKRWMKKNNPRQLGRQGCWNVDAIQALQPRKTNMSPEIFNRLEDVFLIESSSLLKGTFVSFQGCIIHQNLRASFRFVDDAARPNSGRVTAATKASLGTTFSEIRDPHRYDREESPRSPWSNWKFSEILTVREWFKKSWTNLQQPIPIPSFKMFFEHTPKFWKKAPCKSKKTTFLSVLEGFSTSSKTLGDHFCWMMAMTPYPVDLNQKCDLFGDLYDRSTTYPPPKVCGIC